MATVQGRRFMLAPGRTIAAQTDSNGAVWAAVDVDASGLGSPTLTFRSKALAGGQLVVLPDADVQQHLKTVTPEDLAAGTDGAGIPVLQPGVRGDADKIAAALHEINYLTTEAYARRSHHVPGVRLRQIHGVSLEVLATIGSPMTRPPTGGRSWLLSMRSGKLVFRMLDGDEVAAMAARRFASSPTEVRGLFGVDWGDVWDSVAGGISSVLEVAVHDIGQAVVASVTFIVNGVELVVSTVLTAAAQVFDLVTGIFSQIATALGTVAGWLMKEIGYLFGWGNILKRRNEIKTLVMGIPAQLVAKLPYPAQGTPGSLSALVTEIRDDFESLIGKVDTSPSNAPFGSWGFPSPTDAIGDVLSPISWVIEKIQAMAGSPGALPAAPTSLTGPMETFSSALSGDVLNRVNDAVLQGTVGEWMAATSALASGKPSELLTPIQHIAQDLGAMLFDGLTDFDQLARSLWAPGPMGDLFTYFDISVEIPFLSGFYHGLTENDLSMLDVMCLMVAIIDDASGNEDEVSLRSVAEGLYWAGIGTRLISSVTFAFARKSPKVATFFDILDTAVCLAITVVVLFAVTDVFNPWIIQSVFYLFAAGAAFMGKLISNDAMAALFTIFSGVIGIIGGIATSAQQGEPTTAVVAWLDAIALVMGAIATLATETKKPLPGYPVSAVIYTVLQTGLATGCAVAYHESPSAAPRSTGRPLAPA